MKIKSLVIGLAIGMFLTGCFLAPEGDSVKGTTNVINSSIVGTWTSDDEGDPESYKVNYMTFKSDGTILNERFYRASPTTSAFYNFGVYTASEDSVDITFSAGFEYSGSSWHPDAQDEPDAYPYVVPRMAYKIEGDSLFIINPNNQVVGYKKAASHPVRTN